MQLVQGRERDDLEGKMEKTRRSIVNEERDFRDFVSVLEKTSQEWENEWRGFCDVRLDSWIAVLTCSWSKISRTSAWH